MRTALLLAALAPLPTLGQITVELGPEETVMSWSGGETCGTEDIPDQPARAFVDAAGRVQLIAGHFELYRSVGGNLKSVVRDCSAPVQSSHHDPDPRDYDDTEWIFSTYTLDGRTVYGLVHNEYQGWAHGSCSSGDAFNCWWNAVTLIVSQDAGATFRHAAPLLPPAHVIASSPYDYDPDNTTGPFGFFEPSNVLSSGGAYYALLHLEPRAPDDGLGCVRGTTETRTCASAPGGIQARVCGSDCTVLDWPGCADAVAPPPAAPGSSARCGCGLAGEASAAWILLAGLAAYRRARGRSPHRNR